ncbi:phosphotransferase [Microbacterium betulae]|uniref:Phosphotransferase n=1 Tax=Microbacterium betulae TaxID=2981139 RepID=A0AA97I617_9MICO|nr:phosphotransferase [Microbacterium sp. AB]WOF22080.1 phosphotransferase [Microbacterium sp. AB]
MGNDEQDVASLVRDAAELLGRRVHFDRFLSGGQHAVTAVVLDEGRPLVVRRFPPGDDAVAREAATLPRLASLGALVPQLVAHDGDAEHPLIVTTMLGGTTPPPGLDPDRIAREMARVLARIHALPGSGLPHNPVAPPRGDGPLARRSRDGWEGLDTSERVLAHTDFWSGNAVWRSGSLTGIVDWSGASDGPRGVDLAWCRQDLVLLGSHDAAHLLLREYERHAGVRIDDMRAWDVHAGARAEDRVETWAPNYAGIGRAHLTETVLRERLDAWNQLL